MQDQVGGHLKQEVAEEEDPGAEAKHCRGEAEVGVHGERRETDIHAVEEGDEVQQHDEGYDAQGDFAHYPLFDCAGHVRCSS